MSWVFSYAGSNPSLHCVPQISCWEWARCAASAPARQHLRRISSSPQAGAWPRQAPGSETADCGMRIAPPALLWHLLTSAKWLVKHFCGNVKHVWKCEGLGFLLFLVWVCGKFPRSPLTAQVPWVAGLREPGLPLLASCVFLCVTLRLAGGAGISSNRLQTDGEFTKVKMIVIVPSFPPAVYVKLTFKVFSG